MRHPTRPLVRSLVLAAALALLAGPARAITFSGLANLPTPVANGSVDFGDFDNDGDLDVAVAGVNTANQPVTRILRNNGGGASWTDIGAPLVALRGWPCVRWCDYDGDGDLDMVAFGADSAGTPRALLYRNDGGGVFTSVANPFTPVINAAAVWADFDNDGRPDLAVTGVNGGVARFDLYHNAGGGQFTPVATGIPGYSAGGIDVADFDRDGRLDLVVSGSSSGGTTNVYRNTPGGWVLAAGLVGVNSSRVQFGDYDGDGWPDLALTGAAVGDVTRIYHNQGNSTFASLTPGFGSYGEGGLGWADADGDGDLDLLFTGISGSGATGGVGVDASGTFTLSSLGLPADWNGDVAWGDVTGDGTPDALLTGNFGPFYTASNSSVYANTGGPANAAPSAPGGLGAVVAPGTGGKANVTFSWSAATDDHTPQAGLTYELRIGTTSGGAEVTGADADPATGARRVARFGRNGSTTAWTLALAPGTYYWSVQAVDGALRGGAFATEQVLVVQPFVDAGFNLTGVQGSGIRAALAWGDVNGDGALDLAIAGSTTGFANGTSTTLYRNTAGTLAAATSGLPNLGNPALAWGDFDRDGDLDLAIAGADASSNRWTRIYRNDGAGNFTDIGAGLVGVATGAAAWADYDGDGDLDLAVTGTTTGNPSGAVTKLYRNDNGTFVDSGIALTGASSSALAWGDVDGDGDPDLVVCGYNTNGAPTTTLYRNDGGVFTALASGLPGVAGGSVAFGDCDGDGDLDLAITGSVNGSAGGAITRIYVNDGHGNFTLLPASLTGVWQSAVAWGDYDGDGRPDLVYSGLNTSNVAITRVAHNNGDGTFTELDLGLVGVWQAALAWGDVNGDGRLDLALAGWSGTQAVAKVYLDIGAAPDSAPAAPTALTAVTTGTRTVLRWASSTDLETASAGLSYDIRLGLTPHGGQAVSLPADSLSGARWVARIGAVQGDSAVVSGLPDGDYTFAVQAVDAALRGSALPSLSFILSRMQDTGLSLGGVRGATTTTSVSWADADGDGDLDLLVCGSPDGTTTNPVTQLYRNDAGALVPVTSGLPGLANPAAAWADFDGDGRLDLALAGTLANGNKSLAVYRNAGGTFTDIGAGLPQLYSPAVAWGDYDGDGDPDLLVLGSTSSTFSGAVATLYRNDHGTFTNSGLSLAGLTRGAAAWGDIDGDGDLDLVTCGIASNGSERTQLYRNDGGTLVAVTSGIVNVGTNSAVAFGDFDGDGDLDLAIAGQTLNGTVNSVTTRIYVNDGQGHFTDSGVSLPGVYEGALAWGDYDGDGDLDLAISGFSSSNIPIARLARNDGGGHFTVLDVGIPGVGESSLAWGDYDNDGRLELAVTGNASGTPVTRVYRRDASLVNAPPSAPTGLRGTKSGSRSVMQWSPSTDARTPQAGLSYDVRIGVTSQGGQVVSLPADSVSGWRRLAQRGMAQADSFVVNMPDGIYYWTVQAVDASLSGSPLPAWTTVFGGTLGVGDGPQAPPAEFALRGVTPNPVTGPARVTFDLPRESDVDLGVYDVSGRRVATMLRARFAAGRQAAAWNGHADDGSPLPAGVYLVRLAAGGHTDTRRVVLVR